MEKKIRYKGWGYDFTEVHQFIGNLDVTKAFRKRILNLDCIRADKALSIELENRYQQNQKVLNELKSICSETMFKDIEDYLVDCENTDSYDIKDELADYLFKQEEEHYEFKCAYIHQTVGMAGDDYSGTIYIPIPNNKYFKFEYWM